MMAAEWEAESMLSSSSSEEEVEWKMPGCTVHDCVCHWHFYGSPQTPRVAPGTDCLRIPAGADPSPAWSLIVGVKDGAALRLRRLRVARSGRILGRSDGELEFFHDIQMPTRQGFSASAALAPGGRSLCVLHQADNEKPQTVRLTLQPQTADDTDELHLPEIQETSRCIPISTGGQFWALSATVRHGFEFSVLMRRLVPGDGDGWQQVGETYTSPHVRDDSPGDWFLQGFAVLPLPEAKQLILVSFKQKGLFFTFAPHSGDWTRVPTDATRLLDYVPIPGRAVYVEQDQAVYMLRHNTIYAYKLTYQDDDQGRQQLSLDPPIKMDTVCPFNSCQGYGFLARLGDRLMCSVWISLALLEPCLCDNLHAIVTTFHLRSPAQGGIQVLHSSFRRVDIEPKRREDQEFCFLLAYEDKDSPVLLQHEGQEDLTSSQHVDDPSKMLDCCRQNLPRKNDLRMCYLCGSDGHIARDCSLPPQERSSAMVFEPSSILQQASFPSRPVARPKPATMSIKKHLFIISQIGSQPVICPTGVRDDESLLLEGDNGTPLEPCYAADGGDGNWHFFHIGSKMHAVSSIRDDMLEFNLNKDWPLPSKRSVRRPSAADPFVMVMRVGEETVALTDTLQVFHQKVSSDGSTTWLRYVTDQSHVLRRKVVISGYVELNDYSFMVWDAVTCSCLLFDLGVKQWRVVMPWAAFEDDLLTNPTYCALNGRCVFVDGFIYTCCDGGLSAYQLLHKDHSLYLRKPIFLPFSWVEYCEGEAMCLDYAGKDVESGAILFYVVQGGCVPPENDVDIFIVEVKTKPSKRTPSNKMRPVGVDLVDRITRSSRQREVFDPRCCFAVSL
uniref:Uncharacterized protein n=1 Tax=Avena sativa TaxID=4498 RepID=A0ACD5VCC7_AVESA